MSEKLTSYHPEQLTDVSELFQTGAALARSRFLLQELNTLNKLPLGGRETAKDILTFFHNAEEGFIISVRSQDINHRRIFEHFQDIRPASERDMHEMLKLMGFDWKPQEIEVRRASNDLFAYFHAQATLSFLSMQGNVTFADFSLKPDSDDLDSFELAKTFWHRTLTPDVFWELLTKLHEQTEDILFSPGMLENHRILAAGHFFTAGMNLSSV